VRLSQQTPPKIKFDIPHVIKVNTKGSCAAADPSWEDIDSTSQCNL